MVFFQILLELNEKLLERISNELKSRYTIQFV